MCIITEGPAARRLTYLDEAERKAILIGELVDRFGDKANAHREFHLQNWSVERYSGGGMISHAPPGVLTEFGYTLRQPCGRVHWPGPRVRPSCVGGSRCDPFRGARRLRSGRRRDRRSRLGGTGQPGHPGVHSQMGSARISRNGITGA